MARIRKVALGARLVVIDDDPTLLATLLTLLRAEGHDVRGETDPAKGIELVRTFAPEILLLDFYMGAMTGADVVREIRSFDALVQILLVTGYASERPARTMLAELDIQGYHDKSDGPERLLVLLDAGIKHHRALMRVERQRQAFRKILDACEVIGRLQPLDSMFHDALEQIRPLAHTGDGVIATRLSPTDRITIRAGTGRFEGATTSTLPPELLRAVTRGLAEARPKLDEGVLLVPLKVHHGEQGCMAMEGAVEDAEALEPCELFAQQVVSAAENIRLFERATTDPLTDLATRGYGAQRLLEALVGGARAGTPTVVALLDLDHFKRVNDDFGHAAGDYALRSVAAAIRSTCRLTDVVARWGGEEILCVLPNTDLASASIVAERLRAAIEALDLTFEGRSFRLTASIGVAQAPTEIDPLRLVAEADAALYTAKGQGRNRVVNAASHTAT